MLGKDGKFGKRLVAGAKSHASISGHINGEHISLQRRTGSQGHQQTWCATVNMPMIGRPLLEKNVLENITKIMILTLVNIITMTISNVHKVSTQTETEESLTTEISAQNSNAARATEHLKFKFQCNQNDTST